jgi:hypothetical protein
MRQVQISRTIVFDAPRHARGFFEALVADNLDIGWPQNVEIIFGRRVRRDTKGVFRTAIDRRDNGGVYKHSRIKQYRKDGRALRIETVVNASVNLGCNARLPNLDQLQAKARAANRRILETERAGQGTDLASPAFERIAHPSVDAEGRRTPALRFGDPRVMALAGALCQNGGCAWPGLSAGSRTPTATCSPTTASASPSSTPRSTTGSWCRSPPPTSPRPRRPSGPRYPLSPATSTTTPTAPVYPAPRET